MTKKEWPGWEDMEVEFASLPGIRLRLVLIRKGGKALFYVTNIHDLSPEEIHQCYEQRWDRRNMKYFG